MDISISIMAHKVRFQWVIDLLNKLDAPADVVWDRHQSVWDTGRRALLSYDKDADYHVVLQDDTAVCLDLVATVEKITKSVPKGHPIGLYYGSRPLKSRYGQYYKGVKSCGASWLVLNSSPLWGVGIVLPTEHIEQIVEFGDNVTLSGGAIYDARIRKWYVKHKIDQWYPIPSLVDHRSALEQQDSLLGRTNGVGRTAYEFVGDNNSGLDFEWNNETIYRRVQQ